MMKMVKGLIKRELEIYSADRLEKFDFALHSAGKIIYTSYLLVMRILVPLLLHTIIIVCISYVHVCSSY